MNVLILMGSPRKQGNTAALLEPFCAQLRQGGADVEVIWLYDKKIQPCVACRSCQKDWTIFGCSRADDGQELFDKVLAVASGELVSTEKKGWHDFAIFKTGITL